MSSEPDRRLHPLSLLFHLGATLKDLLVPLLVALFATRSDRLQVAIPAVIAVIASVSAFLKYFSYTYRYGENDLVVRTGMIFRKERHIPYNRIQNIDAVQNVAHRLLNVAVVQVQTGSGAEPEATLSVLPLSDLAEMRERVKAERRDAGDQAPPAADVAAEPVARPEPRRLLHIEPRELLLAGFIENRGMALVLAAMGVLSQFDVLEGAIERWLTKPEWMESAAGIIPNGAGIIVGVAVLFLAATIFVRLLSTVWAVLRLYDFTLARDGNDLRVEYGMFTRVTATIPIRRVQTISIHQRVIHRALGRAAIRVTTAGASGIPGAEGSASADREWLAPIIRTADIGGLVREIDPSLELEAIDWTRAHPRAATRMMRLAAVWALAIAGVIGFLAGWWAGLAVALALGTRAIARARGIAANLGSAIIGERVAFRSGWLHQVVSIARFERIQSASCSQTFFDRRWGMATVGVDTAGMGTSGLNMRYLADATALQLQQRLAQAAVRTPFTW